MKCPQLSKPKANGDKGEKGDSGKKPKLSQPKNLVRKQVLSGPVP